MAMLELGVAVSDMLGITAQGLESIEHRNNEKKLFQRLKEIIDEYQISEIVIGYPLNMNASVGPRAKKTDAFIKKLEEVYSIKTIKPVDMFPFTSNVECVSLLSLK